MLKSIFLLTSKPPVEHSCIGVLGAPFGVGENNMAHIDILVDFEHDLRQSNECVCEQCLEVWEDQYAEALKDLGQKYGHTFYLCLASTDSAKWHDTKNAIDPEYQELAAEIWQEAYDLLSAPECSPEIVAFDMTEDANAPQLACPDCATEGTPIYAGEEWGAGRYPKCMDCDEEVTDLQLV